jgi:hypothetical protein
MTNPNTLRTELALRLISKGPTEHWIADMADAALRVTLEKYIPWAPEGVELVEDLDDDLTYFVSSDTDDEITVEIEIPANWTSVRPSASMHA